MWSTAQSRQNPETAFWQLSPRYQLHDSGGASPSEKCIVRLSSMIIASIPGSLSIISKPFSGPSTKTAVESPSVVSASSPIIVTLCTPRTDLPVSCLLYTSDAADDLL